MGIYAGENNWVENVYQFEETDVVQGGPDGIDNRPLKQLSDRTQYLKNRLGIIHNFESLEVYNGSGTINGEPIGKIYTLIGEGVSTITLGNANTFKHGHIIPLSSFCNANSAIHIATTAGQVFEDLDGDRTTMYMHHKEHLILVALTDHFRIIDASGNFYCVGEEVKSRKQLINTLRMQGQLLLRAEHPRLWEFVQSLTMGQEVTTEATWFSDSVSYRGLFTTGNGTTTFRLPDERGMSERMVDAGRGIDLSRPHNYPGGYEKDMFPAHRHKTFVNNGNSFNGTALTANNKPEYRQGNGGGVNNNNYEYNITGNNAEPTLGLSSSEGGSENIVKNIGKLHLIKY